MSESDSPKTTKEDLASLESKWLKLRMAETARLMMDNQAVLDAVNRQTARDRDYENRVRDTLAERQVGIPKPNEDAVDVEGEPRDMKINIDSPTTINYHTDPATGQSEQAAEQPESFAKKKLIAKALPYVAAGLLAGGGLGTAIPWLLGAYNSQAADQPAPAEYVDTTTSIGIGGGEPTLEW